MQLIDRMFSLQDAVLLRLMFAAFMFFVFILLAISSSPYESHRNGEFERILSAIGACQEDGLLDTFEKQAEFVFCVQYFGITLSADGGISERDLFWMEDLDRLVEEHKHTP